MFSLRLRMKETFSPTRLGEHPKILPALLLVQICSHMLCVILVQKFRMMVHQ
jgi:hypothetical protein